MLYLLPYSAAHRFEEARPGLEQRASDMSEFAEVPLKCFQIHNILLNCDMFFLETSIAGASAKAGTTLVAAGTVAGASLAAGAVVVGTKAGQSIVNVSTRAGGMGE